MSKKETLIAPEKETLIAPKKETQITTKEETSLQLTELANEFAGAVSVRSEILKVARLKLAQALSQASGGGLAKPGEFNCEIKGTNYGTEVSITPILIGESASLLSEDGRVICASNDLLVNRDGIMCKNCPYGEFHSDWGTKDNKKTPKCKLAIDTTCLVNDENDPVIFSFRKMSHKAGKELVNYVVRDPKKVPFGTKYKLTSEQQTKDKYKFFVVRENISKENLPYSRISEIIPVARKIMEAKRKGLLEQEMDQSVENIPV